MSRAAARVAHLPTAIQKALARSESLERQQRGEPEPEANPAEAMASPDPAEEPATPTANTAESTPGTVEPTPETTPAADTEIATLRAQLATEQQRYAVLDGKYRAETGQLRSELNDQRALVNQALDELARLKVAPASAGGAPTSDQGSDRNAEIVGPEALAVIRDEIQARVAPVQEQVGRSSWDAFVVRLDTAIPNRDQIDSDPDFHAYCAEVLPETGMPRQASFTHAAQTLDLNRAVRLYQQFLNRRAASAQPALQPEPTPAGPAAVVKPLESRVTPGGSATSSTGVPKAPRIFTRTEVTQFYQDKAHGKYRGREDELKTLEREITQASLQGRIRG